MKPIFTALCLVTMWAGAHLDFTAQEPTREQLMEARGGHYFDLQSVWKASAVVALAEVVRLEPSAVALRNRVYKRADGYGGNRNACPCLQRHQSSDITEHVYQLPRSWWDKAGGCTRCRLSRSESSSAIDR
jgi:hypothetical protein